MPREKQSNAAIEQGHGIAEDVWTWQLRPTDTAKPLTMIVRCCLCRMPLYRKDGGWCHNCNTWPINVSKIHPERYSAEPGEWIDTGEIPVPCSKEVNIANARKLAAMVSGPGWPEKIVPLRRDMIPRSWKRGPLKVVGQTPLGYDIVLPAGIAENSTTDDLPF